MLAKGIALQRRARGAILAACLVLFAPAVWAHGTVVAAALTQAVQVRAVYETGQPMAQAQVALFAPNNPAQVWARGTTDDDGVFFFVPDPAQSGIWTIQVRQAGHGAVVNVSTSAGGGSLVVRSSGELSQGQKLMMVALVGWGALGTALFFRRRKGGGHASA